MTLDQASIITTLLDIATQGNWPHVAAEIQDRGYKPPEVISAWKALEELAGQSGAAPELTDFE